MRLASTEVEEAVDRLNSALLRMDDDTGRHYTLILIPRQPDEDVEMSLGGKPIPEKEDLTPERIFANAMERRKSLQP